MSNLPSDYVFVYSRIICEKKYVKNVFNPRYYYYIKIIIVIVLYSSSPLAVSFYENDRIKSVSLHNNNDSIIQRFLVMWWS